MNIHAKKTLIGPIVDFRVDLSSVYRKVRMVFKYWVDTRCIEMGIRSTFFSGHATCPPTIIDSKTVSNFPVQKEEKSMYALYFKHS